MWRTGANYLTPSRAYPPRVCPDCHGLPVEFEIDKKLGISGRDDVLKMGIKAYNAECRAIVMRYSKEWEVAFTPTLALILP